MDLISIKPYLEEEGILMKSKLCVLLLLGSVVFAGLAFADSSHSAMVSGELCDSSNTNHLADLEVGTHEELRLNQRARAYGQHKSSIEKLSGTGLLREMGLSPAIDQLWDFFIPFCPALWCPYVGSPPYPPYGNLYVRHGSCTSEGTPCFKYTYLPTGEQCFYYCR